MRGFWYNSFLDIVGGFGVRVLFGESEQAGSSRQRIFNVLEFFLQKKINEMFFLSGYTQLT